MYRCDDRRWNREHATSHQPGEQKASKSFAHPVWLPAAESRGATWAGQTVACRLDILTCFPQQKNNQQENQTLLNIQELVIKDMKFK